MRNILRVDGTILLANFVSKSQNKCTRTCCRIVNGNVGSAIGNHYLCNDTCNRMRGIVLRVLAEIFIIVFDKVLEDLSKEVVLLLKYTFKTAVSNLINYCAAEPILFLNFNNVLRDSVKQAHLRLSTGSDREDVNIKSGDILQRFIKKGMEILFILMIEQIRNEVCLFELCGIGLKVQQKQFVVIVTHFREFFFNFSRR